MRKQFLLPLGLLFSLFLASCASSGKKAQGSSEECNFPSSPSQPAPSWVCGESVPGYEVVAVGVVNPSKAGIAFMEQQALTMARVKLAQQIQTHIQNMVKQYVESSGTSESETVDQLYTSITKQITNEKLTGTKMIRRISDPSGVLYLLVGMDKSQFMALAKGAVQSSFKNDEALWQKFQAKKGQDELQSSILGTAPTAPPPPEKEKGIQEKSTEEGTQLTRQE